LNIGCLIGLEAFLFDGPSRKEVKRSFPRHKKVRLADFPLEFCKKMFRKTKYAIFLSSYVSQIHTMAMQIKLLQQNCNVLIRKNLTPWRDSNPGSSVL
jgi:hypothetical protein